METTGDLQNILLISRDKGLKKETRANIIYGRLINKEYNPTRNY